MNMVVLSGRVCDDPVLKRNKKGRAVIQLKIEEEAQEEAQTSRVCAPYNVLAWDQLAERVSKKLTSGNIVVVMGRLSTRKTTIENNTENRLEVVANGVYIPC